MDCTRNTTWFCNALFYEQDFKLEQVSCIYKKNMSEKQLYLQLKKADKIQQDAYLIISSVTTYLFVTYTVRSLSETLYSDEVQLHDTVESHTEQSKALSNTEIIQL